MSRDCSVPYRAPFTSIMHGSFIERPNRFRVRCVLATGAEVDAFLPNPGRMWELLFPGVRLYLVPRAAGESPERKTAFTVVAVERDGAPVFLHTHVTNDVAERVKPFVDLTRGVFVASFAILPGGCFSVVM